MSSIESVLALSGPLSVLFWGMILLLVGLRKDTAAKDRVVLPSVTIVGFVIGAFLSIATTNADNIVGGTALPVLYFGNSMAADSFGALLCVIVCIVGALAAMMSGSYLEDKGINQGEFYALLLFATGGAMLMVQSFDLVNVFVGLEVLSVALYVLAGFARRERRSEEAAVKYFLLGAFATGFLLFGASLVFGAVGMAIESQPPVQHALRDYSFTNLYAIRGALGATLETATPLISSPIFVTGIGLVIVGLGFKAAIVPFHSYAPDVYEGAPTPITAFMSVAAKIGAFGALMRLVIAISGGGTLGAFHDVIWGLSVATMLVGNILAVRQTNMKRMLAYSSIAHAGYILVGVLATASADADAAVQALSAVRFYLFAYTFMNLGGFAIMIWLGRKGHGEYLAIREYDGLAKRNPLAAAAMTIVMLSLAGIPPTAGFVGKLYLFLSAIKAGEVGLSVIALVVSAIGVFYYLNLIAAMYFREPKHDFAQPRAGGARAAALIAVAAIVLFGVVPSASGVFWIAGAAGTPGAGGARPAGTPAGSNMGAAPAPQRAPTVGEPPVRRRRRAQEPGATPTPAVPTPGATASAAPTAGAVAKPDGAASGVAAPGASPAAAGGIVPAAPTAPAAPAGAATVAPAPSPANPSPVNPSSAPAVSRP